MSSHDGDGLSWRSPRTRKDPKHEHADVRPGDRDRRPGQDLR
ncbi:hypothetical protein SSFG_07886 [Streptomyces viridosporus ATCC 14672]|uniref:Uncharacterized protein n=1 Tax=Streptomyces viridosporus (strain ATCC 14672 / DSM 40746 / JCM 4963 / KCTC 9882 / NRRL B-12104 / FH 1290) TaxID=566461 RepID=D5ZPQ6_STRV1|nr:hypothetical protein SSFG_07886 [Streptomyces viridosporus ATCC 14672]